MRSLHPLLIQGNCGGGGGLHPLTDITADPKPDLHRHALLSRDNLSSASGGVIILDLQYSLLGGIRGD